MSVYCPNNDSTYANLQVWVNAVRDTDFGSQAIAVVSGLEYYTTGLAINGSWPNGLKITAKNAFNGQYDLSNISSLVFEGGASITVNVNTPGTPTNRKVIEISDLIIRHRAEGILLQDSTSYVDYKITENFIESTGSVSVPGWASHCGVQGVFTTTSTNKIYICNNIILNSPNDAIRLRNKPDGSNSNQIVNNNVIYNASAAGFGRHGIFIDPIDQAVFDLNYNVVLMNPTDTEATPIFSFFVLGDTYDNNATEDAPLPGTPYQISYATQDDFFVDVNNKDFRTPIGAAVPDLGAFNQTNQGNGTSYPVDVTSTDFTLIDLDIYNMFITSYPLNLIIGGDNMAEGYTRQSTFTDGDVILAEHGNAEFDQLVNTFSESIGHNHDGSIGGGSLITKIGDVGSGNTIEVTSNGVEGNLISNDGTLAASSQYKVVSEAAIKTYVDDNTSATAFINAVESTPDVNFVNNEELAKVQNLPSSSFGYVEEAPVDGNKYLRTNNDWESITLATSNKEGLVLKGTPTNVDLATADRYLDAPNLKGYLTTRLGLPGGVLDLETDMDNVIIPFCFKRSGPSHPSITNLPELFPTYDLNFTVENFGNINPGVFNRQTQRITITSGAFMGVSWIRTQHSMTWGEWSLDDNGVAFPLGTLNIDTANLTSGNYIVEATTTGNKPPSSTGMLRVTRGPGTLGIDATYTQEYFSPTTEVYYIRYYGILGWTNWKVIGEEILPEILKYTEDKSFTLTWPTPAPSNNPITEVDFIGASGGTIGFLDYPIDSKVIIRKYKSAGTITLDPEGANTVTNSAGVATATLNITGAATIVMYKDSATNWSVQEIAAV